MKLPLWALPLLLLISCTQTDSDAGPVPQELVGTSLDLASSKVKWAVSPVTHAKCRVAAIVDPECGSCRSLTQALRVKAALDPQGKIVPDGWALFWIVTSKGDGGNDMEQMPAAILGSSYGRRNIKRQLGIHAVPSFVTLDSNDIIQQAGILPRQLAWPMFRGNCTIDLPRS